jgi:transcription-repair coupling factor (superfamily II helicase)
LPDFILSWPLHRDLRRLDDLLGREGRAELAGLEGSALAFALAGLWQASPRPMLLLCPTAAEAENLFRDLSFFIPSEFMRLFPAYELSPYQGSGPPVEITAQRLAALWDLTCRGLSSAQSLILVTCVRAIRPRLCPPEYLLDRSLLLKVGMEIDRDYLLEQLVSAGYSAAGLVEQVGDMAARGSVVDCFPANAETPLRMEFWGDEIVSIRTFTASDQRSQSSLSEFTLIPCTGVDLSAAAAARARLKLTKLAGEMGFSSRKVSELSDKIDLRSPFSGIESWSWLYFDNLADIFTYLPENTLRVMVEPGQIQQRLDSDSHEMENDYRQALEEGLPALPVPYLRRTAEQIGQGLQAGPCLSARSLSWDEEKGNKTLLGSQSYAGLHEELSRSGDGSLLTRFMGKVSAWREQGMSVLLVCRSDSQMDRLHQLLREWGEGSVILSPEQTPDRENICLVTGNIGRGFSLSGSKLIVVTEDEIFGAPKVLRQKLPPRMSALLAALDDLAPGDLVVHSEHGIARYEGMQAMVVGAAESDFLLLVFQGGDKLYLPADRMSLISKYRGPGDVLPPLDRLGGKMWARTKGKVKKAIEAIARDLVELYAARRSRKGHAFAPPDSAYREFESTFTFEETPDQARAIGDVIADLSSERPMDRLICGDVGFGKTEVALRAAWLVAMQGKQVAVLVPTTVLAEQHFQTFSQRLRDQPLEVASLSRFRTPGQQKEILRRLASGQLDIVIGTHRLLQKDVQFCDLGLMVLDEEHRFGVRDKEKLKKIRKLVDVLTLTATPIPRTLQMSLSGIRDMSVINTPPAERMGIQTYLTTFSRSVVERAVKRELERGGQVFLVHNRVQDIHKIAALVQELFPQIKLGLAHGRLPEEALEKVMMDFVSGQIQVLVSTTIIESGLDIPAANTIIINDADKLGLSQIYQLRGRVGRGNAKAYAYLLVKEQDSLTRDAAKRLKALMEFTHLGAGFAIAMHDLEIRGGGNLLGEVQSGQLASVGYELYVRMLEEETARLKGEEPEYGPEPEINLSMPSRLPESYIPDSAARLSLYKRLSQVRSGEDVALIEKELADRFGPLPEMAANLLFAVDIKLLLRKMFAIRFNLSARGLQIFFAAQPKVDLDKVLRMAHARPDKIKVYPEGKIWAALAGGDHRLLAQSREFLRDILPSEGADTFGKLQ